MKFKDIKLPLGVIVGFIMTLFVLSEFGQLMIDLTMIGILSAVILALALGLPIRRQVILDEKREQNKRYIKELKERFKGYDQLKKEKSFHENL